MDLRRKCLKCEVIQNFTNTLKVCDTCIEKAVMLVDVPESEVKQFEHLIYEDELEVLRYAGTSDKIIEGDAYHDKVNYRIKGFLKGLDYAGIKYHIRKIDFTVED